MRHSPILLILPGFYFTYEELKLIASSRPPALFPRFYFTYEELKHMQMSKPEQYFEGFYFTYEELKQDITAIEKQIEA